MSFDEVALSRDRFLGGALSLWQPLKGYRAAIDPVLLAAFAPARPGDRVLELGCGAGVAMLCLAARMPGIELHGLEAQAEYADLAERNAFENGLAAVVHRGDLRRPPEALREMSFDLVLANPPFYRAGSATAPADGGRNRAHVEEACLGEWIDAGLRRLAPGGRLAMVHRAERLGEILVALERRTGAIEVLPVVPRHSRPASRVLVRARKGSSTPLTLFSPLTLHKGKSHAEAGRDYTEQVEKVLRGEADLLPDDVLGDI